jgi:hypothetical protein
VSTCCRGGFVAPWGQLNSPLQHPLGLQYFNLEAFQNRRGSCILLQGSNRKMVYLRKYRKFAVAFAAVYLAISAGLVIVMRRPILFSEVMRHVPDPMMGVFPFKRLWFLARAGRLKVGDPAPGFNLPTADRQSAVSLASFRRQRPVVLIFGSYT